MERAGELIAPLRGAGVMGGARRPGVRERPPHRRSPHAACNLHIGRPRPIEDVNQGDTMEKKRKPEEESRGSDRQEEREGGYGDAGRDRSWTGKEEKQQEEGSSREKKQG